MLPARDGMQSFFNFGRNDQGVRVYPRPGAQFRSRTASFAFMAKRHKVETSVMIENGCRGVGKYENAQINEDG